MGLEQGRVGSASAMTSAEREDRDYVSAEQVAAWKREFHASAALRREFATEGSYVGFKTGEAQGRIRILTSKVDSR